MGKRLGALIDSALANNGEVVTSIDYEICQEFIVPLYKNITRRSSYELTEALSKHIGSKEDGGYTPIHFGWIENTMAKSVYPAHMCTVIRIGTKYYYVPTEFLENIEKALASGNTKRIENFEETKWLPRHIELNGNKEEFGSYLIFSDKMSSKLKTAFNYILPGAGITQFICRDILVTSNGVEVMKIKDSDIYTYYLKDVASGTIVDLGICNSSDLADNIVMDDGEIFKIELDISKLEPRLYTFGEYITGREIKIPASSKRDLNVLVKAIQDNNVTLSQLEKFETITGIGHRIMASEELDNCVFIKLPTNTHFLNIVCKNVDNIDRIKLQNGVHIPSSTELLKIYSRIMSDSYTVADVQYILENAVN